MEDVSRPLHHDVIIVSIADTEDVRGDAVAGAGERKVLYRLKING